MKENVLTDREILSTYINLDNSCLTKAEKKEVVDLLHEHKDAFSLRDEIGILKGFSAYSSPVMFISRNMMHDKRVVTDFRHLNMCIAKNNLVYLLLKDTCALLGSSR